MNNLYGAALMIDDLASGSGLGDCRDGHEGADFLAPGGSALSQAITS